MSGVGKNSDSFIRMSEKLRGTYRQAKTWTLIVDNYVIHKSCKIERWLLINLKFNLLFLLIYSSRLNKIELLWLSLHETVTCHHQCRYMWQLLIKVKQFMVVVSPLPSSHPGKTKMWQ
ncbi:hypothetical protein EP164_04200 [Photorhabdus luminescens subsp. sonorensis]|uniref:Tc1-like transposase DDE domain-containing protein n=1 Tax=Photorhabdus luminescens subsp. sonorensis TaxID=1173677 RepID=A0A5C4RL19_PHOLU|nr:hypothetical protein EP164_04200 [Photorhabdus luminescens subsp. sonorensis]